MIRRIRPQLGAIVLITAGILLLLAPDSGTALLSKVLGWLLVAVGAAGLLVDELADLRLLGAGSSITALIFGIVLLKNPMLPAKLLGIGMGLLLIVQGLNVLSDAQRLRSCGGNALPSLILGGGMTLLGAGLMFSPLATSRLLMTVVGILMILFGTARLIARRNVTRYLKQQESPKIIDAEE